MSARPSRTLLLIAAVVLSAALIAAVSCALASVNRAVEVQLEQTIGLAEVRLRPTSGDTLPASLVERVRAWPETEHATGSLSRALAIRATRPSWARPQGTPELGPFIRELVTLSSSSTAYGIDPALEPRFRSLNIVEGRAPQTPDEVAIDRLLLDRLNGRETVRFTPVSALFSRAPSADPALLELGPATATEREASKLNTQFAVRIGSEIEALRSFKAPVKLKVVGIIGRPPFGGSPQAYLTLEALSALAGVEDRVSEVNVIIREEFDPTQVVEARKAELGPRVLMQTTQRVTSGLNKNMRSNQLGFIMATVMAFLAAAFIITTGLSTGVTERQRELSILRCVGATRAQLALSQLFIGAIVGGLGGLIGMPLGLSFAAIMTVVFKEQIPSGLAVSGIGLTTAAVGALFSGLAGAAFPAWRATRVTPLEGLAVRSRPVRPRTVALLVGAGLACLVIQLLIVTTTNDGQFIFWAYATFGLPVMFIGYFLLSAPTILAVTFVLQRPLTALLGLPPRLLPRTINKTPFRFGFTAGAMMSGLAIMVAIWTQGGAILRDWLDKLKFPDAFVTGVALNEASQARIEALPFVTDTCAITLQPVETNAFGVRALQQYKTSFIAFEPEPFFKMADLAWVEPKTLDGQLNAQRRLEQGGAIIVAREFMVAQGVRVGDTFRAGVDGKEFDFEIVGVVTSPGLEIVSQFFNIGQEFTDQAIHAVFGSRKDLEQKFGSKAISLIQIGLSKDISDEEAMSRIQEEVIDAGVLAAGSGRQIKENIKTFVGGSLVVSSTVAIFAMVIAGFGVANIVVAGIYARQFEFGVLRAVGASRWLICRLVLAEAALIAFTAMILGTLLGIQGVFAGQKLDRLLFGLELNVRPPPLPIIAGCGFVLLITLCAAAPAVIALGRKRPRELLAAVKG